MATVFRNKPATLIHKLPAEHRWTYAEYQRLAGLGLFFKHRVELLGGKVIDMAPQNDRHTTAIMLSLRAIERAFGPGHVVRPQMPLHLDRRSGPEPDIAVVAGEPRDYLGKGHPKSALLLVEISDTTLWYDRRRKAPRYARAGFAGCGARLWRTWHNALIFYQGRSNGIGFREVIT